MIPGYTDQAANERTYLAWVRTGLAIVALGFVIEKFSLFLERFGVFLTTLDPAVEHRIPHAERFGRDMGPLGDYGWLALILAGVSVIVLSPLRYVRTARRLAASDLYASDVNFFESLLLTAPVLFAAAFSLYFAFA
jgi:putative membrane protein